jgi:hypothetical protein
MSHYEVAEEIRRALDFSPRIQVQEDRVWSGEGESWLRVSGNDGHTYGILVRRMDTGLVLPEVTGEIMTVSDDTVVIQYPYQT